jgi:hypothetical protein
MDLDWYCNDMLKKRHQCRCGILWTFSSLKRQRSPHQYVWFHTFNFRQNKVVIVISVISKILNPSKCWMVTIQLLLNDTLFLSELVLFIASCYCWTFVCFSAFLWFSFLFDAVTLFNLNLLFSVELFSIRSVLILEMYFRYFDPVKYQLSSNQKHSTADRAPSFVLV